MPRPIRRADRALSQEQAREILVKGKYGILSTVSSEGQPYGVPVNYSSNGDVLYFHCAVEGHKLENIATNNRVSFCVVGETEILPDKFATRYESSIVFGKAFELNGNEKLSGLIEVLKKYSPDFMEKGLLYIKNNIEKTRVYKIEIESFSGKARR
jgi:nitroimidazol reductase NimA-like FMN-containing flavoprotein (pyridoxamine 5'-phosphate oxidase superfamily)